MTAAQMKFDFYGRKKLQNLGDTTREPLATQLRLRESLLHLGRRNTELHHPLECKRAEEFWQGYFDGRLYMQLHLKNLVVTEANMQELSTNMKNVGINFSSTECVQLHRNNIGNDGMICLGELLLRSPNLLHLQVSCNGFTGKAITSLQPLFSFNKSLLSLILCENKLGLEGFTAVATFLSTNTTLRVLDLTSCEGKNDSIDVLCREGLSENSTLLFIRLSNNDFDEEAAGSFADMVRQNKTLMYLDLSDTLMNGEAAKTVCDALEEENYSIVEMDLSLTDIDEDDDSAVLQRLEQVFLRNIDAPKVALQQALATAKGPWRRSKLMVVGQGMAGKTATVRSLLGMEFRSSWDSTVGAEVIQTKTRTEQGQKSWVPMSKFDLEKHNNEFMTEVLVTQAGSILADLKQTKLKKPTKTKVVKHVSKANPAWMQKFGKQLDTSNKTIGDAIADIADDVALEASGSQKDQIIFSIWDYGGQKVFYTLHHLFLTQFGLYLIVFNLVDLLKKVEESKTYIKFWLESCTMHAPDAPLFFVGTRADQLKDKDLLKVNEILKAAMEKKKDRFKQVVEPNETLCFFAVDNKSGRGISDLRTAAFSVASEQPHVDFEIPIFWLGVLDAMFTSQVDASRSFLKMEEVLDIVCKQTGMKPDHDGIHAMTLQMLKFFHELGVILHFTSSSELQNLVILNPQWAIDALSKVIRDKDIHKYGPEEIAEFKKAGVEEDANRMLNDAIVSRDLVEFLWKNSNLLKNHYRDTAQELTELKGVTLVEFFLQLMKKTLLLSEYKSGSSSEEEYIVPSLLKSASKKDVKEMNKWKTQADGAIVFDFSDSFLPVGLFQRITSLLLEFAVVNKIDTTPFLTEEFARILINEDEEVLLHVEEDEISMHLKLKSGFSKKPEAFHVMEMIMQRVKTDSMGAGLKWKVYILKNNERVSVADARTQNLQPWFRKEESAAGTTTAVDIDSFLNDF